MTQISRTKSFLYNTTFSIISQIAIFISGLIVPYIMLQEYGSEINGISISISQIIKYFMLVEAGLANASIFALYEPLAKKKYKEINGIISATKIFYNKSGLIFLILTIGLALSYPFIIKTTELSSVGIFLLTLILATSGTIDFFSLSKYRALLTADQKLYIVSISTTIYIIFNTLIIYFFAKSENSIIFVRTIALFSIFARTIYLKLYCNKYYKYLNFKEKPNYDVLKKRWDSLYLQILGSIHTGAPIIFVTFFTNIKLVSVYGVFNMIIGGVGGLISVFTSGLFANFGNIISKNETNTLKEVYSEFEFLYYIIISITYSVTLILILPFIRLYTNGVTDINYSLPILAFLITFNGLVFNLKTPQGTLVIAAGLFKETRIQTTIQGLISIVGGLIGVIGWGINGVLLGSIVSNIYRTIDLLIFVPREITNTKIRISFIRILRCVFVFFLSILFTLFSPINPINFIEWVKYAIFFSLITALFTLVLNYLLERDEFINILNRILNIF